MAKKLNYQIITAKPEAPNPVTVFLVSKRPGSRETYEFCLNKVARKLGMVDAYSFHWEALRFEHVTLIAAWMTKDYSSNYAFKTMTAVRGILKTCRILGLMPADDYWNALEGCKVKIDEVPSPAVGRMLSTDEIQSFLNTCKVGSRNRAIRDAAIFMLMLGTGLRVGEPPKLKYEEFDQSTGKLIVLGKGRKTRTVYVVGDVRIALDDWLKIRGDAPGALFLTIFKGDEIHPKAVATHAIWAMLKERQGRARIKKPFTPHDLRRTFISNMLATGTDLATVASMAGHRSPNTTVRYDRRGEQRKIVASALVKIPFSQRGEI